MISDGRASGLASGLAAGDWGKRNKPDLPEVQSQNVSLQRIRVSIRN